MKIFSTDYLEAMSEDVDGNDWSWKPVGGYQEIHDFLIPDLIF